MKILLMLILATGYLYSISPAYNDSIYNVELTGSACPVISNFKYERYPGSKGNVKFGYGFLIRGMWHPGRMLSIGIMTGYIYLSGDNLPDLGGAYASLAAVPIQVVVSMQRSSLEIGVGLGSNLMISTINYRSLAHGIRSELALTIFGSYFFDLTDRIKAGPELKATYQSYRGILSIMPSINFRLNIFRY